MVKNMAMVTCPRCKKQISDKNDSCTYCGLSGDEIVQAMTTMKPKNAKEIQTQQQKPENEKTNIKKVELYANTLILFAVIFFITGSIFLGLAFNKKNNYYKFTSEIFSDYTSVDKTYLQNMNTNAYVIGDAYNYIINGTYFTGYAVIAGTAYIIAGIFLVTGILISTNVLLKQ